MTELLIAFCCVTILLAIGIGYFFYERTARLTRRSMNVLAKIEGYFAAIEARIVRPFDEIRESATGADWVVVFTRGGRESLFDTLRDVRQLEPAARIMVIDNGSADDTKQRLSEMMLEGSINRVVLNQANEIPQWQKCYSIAQAFKLVSLEPVASITWLDDDMRIREPWLALSRTIFSELESQHVTVLNFAMDEKQEQAHPTIRTVPVAGKTVHIKESFNGAFVVLRPSLLERLGLPPIGEGITDAGVEDWYYSRLLKSNAMLVGALDLSVHTGYLSSVRNQEFTRLESSPAQSATEHRPAH